MSRLPSLLLLCVAVYVAAIPTPGRVPKVYNALITSNQNLEPSKAYPVYQPVLHDAAFAFPLQSPFFYSGELPLGNGFISAPAFLPKTPDAPQNPPSAPENPPSAPENPPSAPSTEAPPADVSSSTAEPASSPAPDTAEAENASEAPQTPAPPPSTESPIPLNEFGLPPHVLPISRTYSSVPNFGHFTYSYPALRFYDPFDPFGFHPFAGLPPLYHPLTNVLGQYEASPSGKEDATPTPETSNPSTPAPPSEPSDLNVLNYSPKDPEIANVPPPPLPQGGLKSDSSESNK